MSVDALVQALGQIVYEWHPARDELRWGGDFARILGYDERAMGVDTRSWTARVHPDDLARVMAEVEACKQQRRFYDLEYRFRRSDGSYVWMHDRGVPFFAADGRLATASEDDTAAVWTSEGDLLYRLQGHDRDVNAVAFAPDSRLATGSDDSLVLVWPDPLPIDDLRWLSESSHLDPLTPAQRDAAGLPVEELR